MNIDEMRFRLLEIAWQSHQTPTVGAKLPTDVMAVIYQVLSSQNGWKKLDSALRKSFPEMYDQYGYAKISFLDHYSMKHVPGTATKRLFALTEQEIQDLYKPKEKWPWEKPTDQQTEGNIRGLLF